MPKRWKDVGLGMSNLLMIVLVIALLQPVLRKHIFSTGAGAGVGLRRDLSRRLEVD